MYTSEKRAAAAARKRFTLDPFSDHLIFVQVFRVSLCYHLCLENESLLVFIQSFNILNNSSSELITDHLQVPTWTSLQKQKNHLINRLLQLKLPQT